MLELLGCWLASELKGNIMKVSRILSESKISAIGRGRCSLEQEVRILGQVMK